MKHNIKPDDKGNVLFFIDLRINLNSAILDVSNMPNDLIIAMIIHTLTADCVNHHMGFPFSELLESEKGLNDDFSNAIDIIKANHARLGLPLENAFFTVSIHEKGIGYNSNIYGVDSMLLYRHLIDKVTETVDQKKALIDIIKRAVKDNMMATMITGQPIVSLGLISKTLQETNPELF